MSKVITKEMWHKTLVKHETILNNIMNKQEPCPSDKYYIECYINSIKEIKNIINR